MKRARVVKICLSLTAAFGLIPLGSYFPDLMKSINGPLLHNQDLDLFDPHMSTFICDLQVQKLPPIDAVAEAWFLQSRTLESPHIFFGEEDYEKIVELARRAASRHHWKAMLNLSTYYVDGLVPRGDLGNALSIVEQGMALGIPAAYDRIGTYYANGTGVEQDATRAYAFWQKAARMGNPDSMAFLGEKLDAAYDSGNGSWWANMPIAAKMLKCAVGQGYGSAAISLAATYSVQPERKSTREERVHALYALQHGVRLGCESCASMLFVEFSNPIHPAEMIAPYIDKERSSRYEILSDALGFDRHLQFPNLDKVVPLPPADLPPWNGDRDTLVNAAMGVTPVPFFDTEIPVAGNSRFDVPPPFGLHNTGTISTEKTAPVEGYWRPLAPDHTPLLDGAGKPIRPGLYRKGERFDQFAKPNNSLAKTRQDVSWQYWITTWGDREAVAPRAAKHLIRVVHRPAPFVSSPADVPCPRTGTWQPWVPADHPLAQLINQHWRQAWVVKGQPFPVPKKDWWLDLPNVTITWHLMDDAPVNINQAVKKPDPQQGGDHET